jgi:hypothetical protein
MKRGIFLGVWVMVLNGCATKVLGLGGTSWKEEVRLHDGSVMIVERSQTYGGRSEPFKSAPVAMHSISFTLPGSGKRLEWTSDYDDSLGRTNFNVLALHIIDGVPYLITEPNLCLSYNKWARPNPPYVIFKYEGADWQRISVSALPKEAATINLIVNNGRERDISSMSLGGLGKVSAADVAKLNGSLRQAQYKRIVREPLAAGEIGCEELVCYKGAWVGPGDSIGKRMMDRRTQQSGGDGLVNAVAQGER